MAKIISFSPMIISGKVGDRVYYTRNGKNYSRRLPAYKEKSSSKPIQPEQLKFSRLSKLLTSLTFFAIQQISE